MNFGLFEIVRHKGHDIHMTVADDHESPRDADDPVGSLVIAPRSGHSWSDTDYWAKEYEKELLRVIARQDRLEGAIAEFTKWAKGEAGATVVLPVGRYSHGQDIYYTFKGTSEHGNFDRWDSGFAGFLFDTPERLSLWSYPEVGNPAEIEACMKRELEAFNHWANNDQYCYTVADLKKPADDEEFWTDMMGCCFWEVAEAIAEAKEQINFQIQCEGQRRVDALVKTARPRRQAKAHRPAKVPA